MAVGPGPGMGRRCEGERYKVTEKADKPIKSPWAGRFTASMDPAVERFTASLKWDRRLASLDLRGSRAHVKMLVRQEILSGGDGERILQGLQQIEQELESGTLPFREDLEDLHMNLERRLEELIGEPGARLHTGRSRNDQVATDAKLYCREAAYQWQRGILTLLGVWLERAEELQRDLLPAWTHLQAAQPLSWGHYLLAYCEMLGRDYQRLGFYRELHSVSPLGAGALAGSTLPLDPDFTAQELGFRDSFANSYDVVGDRDFVLELLQIASQTMVHLSRFSEDFVYFASTPVGWVELPDSLCTGSSMMPQKKNPDVLELTRGKTASVLGHTTAVATLLKSLPSSYHRDLQEDKPHLFEVVDTVTDTLQIFPILARQFQLRRRKLGQDLQGGFLMATDVAERLVSRGVPFRRAHERVGALVAECLRNGQQLHDLSPEQFQQFFPELSGESAEVLEPSSVLSLRNHKGSTGLNSIRQQLDQWGRRWQAWSASLEEIQSPAEGTAAQEGDLI